jgi:hypothetical protein
MNEPRTFDREIDYLGEIARILRDLTGFTTLAFELIQNADDADGADQLTFDISDQALVVWNNGQFTDCHRQDLPPQECPWLKEREHLCDFHSFRLVGSEDKRRRADATGAFGIGFTAVYQITDRPELISSGRHWIIDETKTRGRITECEGCEACATESGTRFVLPWARDPESPFRRRTRAPAVAASAPEALLEEFTRAIPAAMLFLRKLTRIEVHRDGVALVSLERAVGDDEVLLDDGNNQHVWRLLRGSFASRAADLRSRFAGKIEEHRTDDVLLALPLDGEVDGRLCAYLPTREDTGLPFHVNADFYPSSDRARLPREGFQGEWNTAAVEAAADVLAEHLLEFRDLVGPERLWSLLFAAYASRDDTDRWAAMFWSRLAPLLSKAPILWTSAETWVDPSVGRVLRDTDEEAFLPALDPLGLNIAHPLLRPYLFQMPRTEVLALRELAVADIAQALKALGLAGEVSREALVHPLDSETILEALWQEIDLLLKRYPRNWQEAAAPLADVALAPTRGGRLRPFPETYRADPRTVELFADLLGANAFLDETRFPEGLFNLPMLAPPFDAVAAVAVLASLPPEALARPHDARSGPWALVGWFAHREGELTNTPKLSDELRALPIYPGSEGARPLDDLALPGDFEDELGLADLVDISAVGEHRGFLERLGAKPLDFLTYALQFVPRAAGLAESEPERWRRVIVLLARRLGDLRDDPTARETLASQPLVEVEDPEHSFWPAAHVYYPSPELDQVLGPSYLRARATPDHSEAVGELYRWLGVEAVARPNDLLDRIKTVTSEPPTVEGRTAIESLILYLEAHYRDEIDPPGQLSELRNLSWLPAKGSTKWHVPSDLFTPFREYLFASQGMFLDLPQPVQQRASDLLSSLGVRTEPETALIIEHLISSAAQGSPVNTQVYVELDRRADDKVLDRLIGRPCIRLPSGTYVPTSHLFLHGHPFGRFREKLGDELRRLGALWDRLGVKEHPGHEDALSVIQDIAQEYGAHNTVLDVESGQVLLTCWRLLETALEQGRVAEENLRALRTIKSIPGPGDLLTLPERVLFEDAPGIADKLGEQVRSLLIKRPEGAWRAMQAAGVRNLSQAVSTHIVEREESQDGTALYDWVGERAPQLARVFDPLEPGCWERIKSVMESISVVSVRELRIRYSLQLRGIATSFESPVHPVPALFHREDATLYVSKGASESHGIALAREFVRAVLPDVLPSTLAPTVHLVLSAESASAADAALDDAGIPRLQAATTEAVTPSVLDNLGTDLETTTGPEEAPESERKEVPEGEQEVDGPAVDLEPGKRLTRSRARDRLPSYVLPDRPESDHRQEDGPDKDQADREVELAGVRRVLEYERSQGRQPEEMEHLHEGYDIESFGDEGQVQRYIEVKSLRGAWDSYGAGLTAAQFRACQRLGDAFWLYVVEHALDDRDAHIFRIRNPAAKADQFLFDDGWKPLTENSEPTAPQAEFGDD